MVKWELHVLVFMLPVPRRLLVAEHRANLNTCQYRYFMLQLVLVLQPWLILVYW